jgi:hypothetical protein
MRTRLAALAAFFGLAGAAFAEMPAGHVNVYYVPTAKIDAGADDRGDGFGVNATVSVLDGLAVSAEYHSVGYDDFGDVSQYRAGVGLSSDGQSGLFAEYIKTDDDAELDGYGVHYRLGGSYAYGQLGYLRLGDDNDDTVSGWEFVVGAAIPVSEPFSAFVDLRRTGLGHDGSALELELADVRAGVRFSFGAGPQGDAQ